MSRLVRIYREEDGDELLNAEALENVYQYLLNNGYSPHEPTDSYVVVGVEFISPNEHLDFLEEMGWVIGLVG